jgi:hypothetical protein
MKKSLLYVKPEQVFSVENEANDGRLSKSSWPDKIKRAIRLLLQSSVALKYYHIVHLYTLYDLQCFQVNSFIILGVLAIFNHGRLAFHGGLLYSRIIAHTHV